MSETNEAGGLAPVRSALLDARRAAIEKAVEECGGEKNKDGTEDSVRAMLVILARESAGIGFDEGVRYMDKGTCK